MGQTTILGDVDSLVATFRPDGRVAVVLVGRDGGRWEATADHIFIARRMRPDSKDSELEKISKIS